MFTSECFDILSNWDSKLRIPSNACVRVQEWMWRSDANWMSYTFVIKWQVMGVILSTAAVAISINKFPVVPPNNTHVKLGFAVMILVWLQPLLSVFRPKRYYCQESYPLMHIYKQMISSNTLFSGRMFFCPQSRFKHSTLDGRSRSAQCRHWRAYVCVCRGSAIRAAWYVVHWLFGTTLVILGWFNIFKGLDEYIQSWAGGERKVRLITIYSIVDCFQCKSVRKAFEFKKSK